jgi:hypothetical protein
VVLPPKYTNFHGRVPSARATVAMRASPFIAFASLSKSLAELLFRQLSHTAFADTNAVHETQQFMKALIVLGRVGNA